ncbi:MAG TPA: efflux RND transporter periplasmic adaptor subunit [Bryobacteraceae bacterium]|nr:efflux RND transporter periplasmic adaptor subunit [Bryobacteraceae bacterium]
MSYQALLYSIPLFLVLLAGCAHPAKKSASEPQKTAVPVQVTPIAETDLQDTYIAPGTIRAKTRSTLSSKVIAYVQSVAVHEGERVHAGQTLVVLDAQELDERYRGAQSGREEAARAIEAADSGVAEAKTNLQLAEVTFKRLKDLFDQRSISNQEFDEAQARLKSAQAAYDRALARRGEAQSKAQQMQAELRTAEITRDYGTVTAPFSGVVVAKTADPGILATPGMPLVILEQEGNYRLEASVEESRLASIHVGDRVPVHIDALNKDLTGAVSEITPLTDATSRTDIVKLDLPATSGIHSGIFGRALFPVGDRKGMAVRADAIIRQGDLEFVLVSEGGIARRRLITTGEHVGTQVAVLAGLRPGDQLIYPVPAGLADGAPLEVQR